MTSLCGKSHPEYAPKVSVCIPARNEEHSIGMLLESLEMQNYEDFEVRILDDRSSDRTYSIAERYQKAHAGKFFVDTGKKKPDGWLGKTWACHQISIKARGEVLIFLDADTELQTGTLERIISSLDYYNLDMLTVWPRQKLITFWEQTVIPLIYYSLFTLLPAIYVYRDPMWLPRPFRKKMRSKFAAACGQCIAFKRKAYDAIGGHSSVKNQVIEDVELAKKIKQNGFRLRMFDGIGTVACRMYRNHNEIFQGLRKNFLAGFNDSLALFILAAILHIVVFVLPFIAIFISIFVFSSTLFFLSVASISIILLQRLILAVWFKMNPIYAFTHPVGVIWFEWLAIVKIRDYLGNRSSYWKGREV